MAFDGRIAACAPGTVQLCVPGTLQRCVSGLPTLCENLPRVLALEFSGITRCACTNLADEFYGSLRWVSTFDPNATFRMNWRPQVTFCEYVSDPVVIARGTRLFYALPNCGIRVDDDLPSMHLGLAIEQFGNPDVWHVTIRMQQIPTMPNSPTRATMFERTSVVARGYPGPYFNRQPQCGDQVHNMEPALGIGGQCMIRIP